MVMIPNRVVYSCIPGVLVLFSGQEHGCCLLQGPPQPPPVFSMLASQTSPPGYKEGEEEGGRAHPSVSKQHASSLSHKSVHGEGQGYLIH